MHKEKVMTKSEKYIFKTLTRRHLKMDMEVEEFLTRMQISED